MITRNPITLKKRFLIWAVVIFVVFVIPGLYVWLTMAQPTFKSSPPSQKEVSPERLEAHVRMLSETLAPRSAVHLGNLNRSADYIRSEFAALNAGTVSEQIYQVRSKNFRNISLLIGDATEPRIVIGAHYDGYGDFPAADDNASGVAGLIELARLMGEFPISGAIEFVAYPLEEPPFFRTNEMGSWRHASELKSDGTVCRYMISIEMIGYFSDEKASQSYPQRLMHLFYPSKGNFVAVIGNTKNGKLVKRFKIGMKGTTDLSVYSMSAPASIPGVDFSDHRNYWRAGFPAIMVSDTAFYRNKAYHTAEDTADRLDYERMSDVVVGIFESVHRLESE